MKRRRLLGSLAGMPAAAALLPAAASAAAAAPPPPPEPASSEEYPKLNLASMEDGAAPIPTFFNAPQREALTKLAAAILPAGPGRAGAVEAAVPEFLDFLIGESPKPVQDLYLDGLSRLARDGVTAATLAPLQEPWSYAGPADRFAQFLQRAKLDIIQATTNSREWAEAQGRGRRGGSPTGYYWRSLD